MEKVEAVQVFICVVLQITARLFIVEVCDLGLIKACIGIGFDVTVPPRLFILKEKILSNDIVYLTCEVPIEHKIEIKTDINNINTYVDSLLCVCISCSVGFVEENVVATHC